MYKIKTRKSSVYPISASRLLITLKKITYYPFPYSVILETALILCMYDNFGVDLDKARHKH